MFLFLCSTQHGIFIRCDNMLHECHQTRENRRVARAEQRSPQARHIIQFSLLAGFVAIKIVIFVNGSIS
jgi:hypothetical protein